MTEIRMPYGRTGLWFVRMPCYLRTQAMGRQLYIHVFSRLTDREVSLGIHKGREAESAASLQALGAAYDRRTSPDMVGIDSRFGTHAVVLYGVIAGTKDGREVVDVNVQGGKIAVERDE